MQRRRSALAKLTYRPIDDRPAPKGPALVLRIMTLVVVTVSLLGMIWIMLDYAGSDDDRPWSYEPDRVRTNFQPLLTTEQIRQEFDRRREEWTARHGGMEVPLDLPSTPSPRPSNDEPEPPQIGNGDENDTRTDPEIDEEWRDLFAGTSRGAEARRDAEHELELARALTNEPVFDVEQETADFIEWLPFQDDSSERLMNEWAANRGRQAPIYERLALRVLHRLGNESDALADAAAADAYFYGRSQEAADAYRGRAFRIEGRLFDLYEVRPPEAAVLQDGTSVERYYEGVVALLAPGLGRNEHPIEQRVVIFQTLSLPPELAAYVGGDAISHQDPLVTDAVMVSLTGAWLRRWVYSRPIAPYSTSGHPRMSQANAPLLLAPEVERSEREPWQLTNELLHQVRDSLREAPAFLETEAAYYAMLAKANSPEDVIETMARVGYFDLIGQEVGPRYRGQGLAIEGMIGDDYVPVLLPPNISGLRRVFRAYVLHDLFDLETERRYLVDMIEPPVQLEPRALVRFDARYYRNVFETDSTTSRIRPLLVVRQIQPLHRDTSQGDLFWALLGAGGLLLLMAVLAFFVISDRRERKAFEQSTLELARKRLEKRGGLKLKPLPGDKPAAKPDDPASDKPES
jgi:hypothetical protein